jgi:transposase
MSQVSVNSWLERFKSKGIFGLQTKSGRGRKPILVESEDKASILEAIQPNCQRLQTAKAEWEAQSGKKVSRVTYEFFRCNQQVFSCACTLRSILASRYVPFIALKSCIPEL